MAYEFSNNAGIPYVSIPREHSVNEKLSVLTLNGMLFLY